MPENQTAAIDVETTDDNDSEGAGLTYSLTGGADQALFSIDPDSGVLTFNTAPDFETPGDAGGDNVYDVQVTVTDSGPDGSLTDVQNVAITVADVTNNAPAITSPSSASVLENQTSAIDVETTDDLDSEGAGLTYSLTGGADQALFSIDPDTGVLTFNAAPDFEVPADAGGDNVYDVQVTVTDSGPEGVMNDFQDIAITVTDESNNAPTITSPGSASVLENQTSAIDVESTDDNDSEGAGLTYSLTGGADQSLFNLDSSTGVLTFIAAPDFEAPADAGGDNVYDVQVTVTDSGPDGVLSDVQDIAITVTDETNAAPTITSAANASVSENQTAAINVESTDDNDSEGAGLVYSLTGGADQSLFSIDANTGVLTFITAPDFETPTDAGGNNVYNVQVTVTDSGPDGSLTDFQDIAITVTDVSETDILYISSNSGGSVDGIVFADEDILAYDSVNDTWSMFFDGSDVGLSGGLDVDAFHVTDTGSVLMSLSQSTNVAGVGTVQDEDIIEFTPTSTGDTTSGTFALVFDGSNFELNANGEDVDSITLDDNGDLIISLTANFSVDAIGGGTLSGGDEDLIRFDATAQAFEMFFDGSDVAMTSGGEDVTGAFIDTTSGEVYLTTLGAYNIAGLAGDADDVFLFAGTTGAATSGTFSAFFDGDTTGIPVESLDGVSLAPAFTNETNVAPTITSAASASVSEGQTLAIDVESTDDNDSEGAGLTYSLTGGADQALFSIDPNTGVVTFNTAPDFEAPADAGVDNVYNIQVTVTDSGPDGSLTDFQDVAITVTNIDNLAPTITSSATASVPEEQTSAIDVESTDDNDSEGAGLIYSLTGGADQALFSIDPDSGVLTFISAPDFEAPADAGGDNVYDVQVTVTDSGPEGSMTDSQDIAITVNDVTNAAPTITSANSASVPENQTSAIDVETSDDNDSEGSGTGLQPDRRCRSIAVQHRPRHGGPGFHHGPRF